MNRFEGYPSTEDRREFLLQAGLPLLRLLPCTNGLRAQTPPPSLIMREREPENLEFPFSLLDGFITANELFYVRNHFAIPKVDLNTYRLRVDGAVDRPFDISYEELRRLPSASTTATLECAGNSRVFLIPQTSGAQWELGAVGNAVWTGVPLAALLDRAGVKRGAVDVVLEGLDRGEPRSEPKPPGKMTFARSIPIGKAVRPEVLLAYEMNGQGLPSSHGFPVRAIVPGFYGMSSVKWISRIRIVTEPNQGYWQTTDYAYWDRSAGTPARKPLMEMRVKSLIARPALREIVKASARYRVFGAAWAGDADVETVELSVDSGRNWVQARLIDKALPFAWRRWEYGWDVPGSPGFMTLMGRATDSRGNRQPEQHDGDMGHYAVHHVLPREIQVVE